MEDIAGGRPHDREPPGSVRLEPTIEVDELGVCYRTLGSKPVLALTGMSLRASAGEIVGVLGPNGSGKSSLLGVLAGSQAATTGRARVLGRAPTDRTLLPLVGFQPEGPLPFRTSTPRAFLQRMAALMGFSRKQSRARIDELVEGVGLADVAARRAVGKLSTGMARRLALAAALLPDPLVLLLDEPTSGLDPDGSLLVIDMLRQRAAAGGTVLMASHHLQEVGQICTRLVMLDGGRKIAEGSFDDLLGTDQVELILSGLDATGLQHLRHHIAQLGGCVVHQGRKREHLFALFRRLRADRT